MRLFIVTTGEMTDIEEPSDLLVRAANEDEARVIAAGADHYGFDATHAVYVYEVRPDGAAGVMEEFRRPV